MILFALVAGVAAIVVYAITTGEEELTEVQTEFLLSLSVGPDVDIVPPPVD